LAQALAEFQYHSEQLGDFTLFEVDPNELAGGNIKPDKKVFSQLSPGEYNVDELGPLDGAAQVIDDWDGWELFQIKCTEDKVADSIFPGADYPDTAKVYLNLEEDETIECEYFDDQGAIIAAKGTDPGGILAIFEFDTDILPPDVVSGTGVIADNGQQLMHDEGAGRFVKPSGSPYHVDEFIPLPTQFLLTHIFCDDGDSFGDAVQGVATYNVQPGEVVECDFENIRLPDVRIIKNSIPDNPQDFKFVGKSQSGPGVLIQGVATFPELGLGEIVSSLLETILGGSFAGPLTFFTLDDDNDGTLSNSKKTTVLPGTFEVTEEVPPGWVLADINCEIGNLLPSFIPFDDPFYPPALAGVFHPTAFGVGTPRIIEDISNNKVTLLVLPGELIECTFTDQPIADSAKITIIKNLIPDGSQDFEFTGDLDSDFLDGQGFVLDDDGNDENEHSSLETFFRVPGAYSVREEQPAGFDLVDIDCQDPDGQTEIQLGAGEAFIDLDAGEHVICVFTNKPAPAQQPPAGITIIKETIPDGPQDFNYTGDLGSFQLDDDADPALPENRTFVGLSPGTFNVTEIYVNGWNLTRLRCQDPDGGTIANISSRTALIDLDAGEHVNCTYTNEPNQSITIIKEVTGSNDPAAFNYTGGLGTFNLTESGHITFPRPPGSYAVTEGLFAGYNLTGLSCSDPDTGTIVSLGTRTATIDLDIGEHINCTYTNTPFGQNITIIKDTVPQSAQDFNFTGLGNFQLDDDADGTLPNTMTFTVGPGSYVVSEDLMGEYNLIDLECLDPDGGTLTSAVAQTAVIDLDPGESITCTYTNEPTQSITIIKDTRPNSAQDFSFTGGLGTFSLDDDTDPTLPEFTEFKVLPGTYTVTEGLVAGYSLINLTCTDLDGGTTVNIGNREATIDLDRGEEITCTYTNKDNTVAVAAANITIIKNTVPNSAQDFNYTGDLGSFSLDDDTDPALAENISFSNLTDGTYVVEEADVKGYELTDITCLDPDGGTAVDTVNGLAVIDLDIGESIVCTYTNEQVQTVTIIKDTIPNGPQDFNFTGNLSPDFTLDDDSDPAFPDSVTFQKDPGIYDIAERPAFGFNLLSITCTDPDSGTVTNLASRKATIDLDPGEDIVCKFTNRNNTVPAAPANSITIVKDTVPQSAQDFIYISDLGSFTLDDDSDPTLSENITFTGLSPGTFNFVEVVVSGFQLNNIICSDPDSGTAVNAANGTAIVDLDAGEAITCTYTNIPQQKITIIKNVVPKTPQIFTYTGNLGSFSLDNDAGTTIPNEISFFVAPGTYMIKEDAIPGFNLTDLRCLSPAFTVNFTERNVTVDLGIGENVTCIFNNQPLQSITIIKDTVPDGQPGVIFLGPLDTFALDDDASTTLPNNKNISLAPGQYNVSERVPTALNLTNINCIDADAGTTVNVTEQVAHIDLDAGEHVTCTFVNKRSGNISIIKDAVSDNPQDFNFTGGFGTFLLDDDSSAILRNNRTFTGVAPGNYNIIEQAGAGFNLTNIDCSDPDDGTTVNLSNRTAVIDLDSNESVQCLFTNTFGVCIPEKIIQILAFSSNVTGVTQPRVFAGNTEIFIGLDGKFHIPLTFANGTFITDSTNFQTLPQGVLVTSRNGDGTLQEGVQLTCPSGNCSSSFVTYTYKAEYTPANITSVNNIDYEQQGDGIAQAGNPEQDEFTVANDIINSTSTVGIKICSNGKNNNFCAHTQGGWGSECSGNNPGCLRDNNFAAVYPNGITIGSLRKLKFTSSLAVQNYLPAGGTPASLANNYTNPIATEAGVFGGQVLALRISVDFSDAGVTNTGLGGTLAVSAGPFAGLTVRQLLAIGEQVLGGNLTALVTFSASISDLNNALTMQNEGFTGCPGMECPTDLQDFHKVTFVNDCPGATPPSPPPPPPPPQAEFCAFTQGGWGTRCSGNNPGCLRDNNFAAVYPSGLTIGGNKTLKFTSSLAVQNYLPAKSTPAVLTNSYINPLSTESGVLGGQVLALRINVNFSDAGITDPGLGGTIAMNAGPFAGLTVRQLLAIGEQVLGGNLSALTPFSASVSALNDALTAQNEGFTDCPSSSPDQCPAVKGPVDHQGCPLANEANAILSVVDYKKTGICGYDNGVARKMCDLPITGATIKLFNREDANFKLAFNGSRPAKNLLDDIFLADIGKIGQGSTDQIGMAVTGDLFAGKLLAILKYVDPVKGSTIYTGKFINFLKRHELHHPGDEDEDDDDAIDISGKALSTYLDKNLRVFRVIEKNGQQKYLGGQMTVILGSQLNVYHPEYTVWAGTEELYPFIFQSQDSWQVNVCLNVPQGYQIAGIEDDEGNLINAATCEQSFVTNESRIFLFRFVETGSPEPDFSFTLEATHNEKTQTIEVPIPGIRMATEEIVEADVNERVEYIKAELQSAPREVIIQPPVEAAQFEPPEQLIEAQLPQPAPVFGKLALAALIMLVVIGCVFVLLKRKK